MSHRPPAHVTMTRLDQPQTNACPDCDDPATWRVEMQEQDGTGYSILDCDSCAGATMHFMNTEMSQQGKK